ncbi:MAG: leucine-rich repeat protein [Prevotella sp.]|nr:leucine-rich repeat protein [Prevotella sp.]
MKSAKTGNGVSLLNTQTFSDCTSLENVEIGTNITKISGKSSTYSNYGCFYNCSSLEQIKVPGNVKEIEDYVFNGCTGLKNVIIDNADTELKLGNNGSSPIFSSCPLDSVYIGRNISYPTASGYGYSPFYRNTSLRTVHITDKETEISENEFYGCTNLKNVRIGDGVTYIGNWAFSGCSSIEYFSFGSAMQSIGKEAFSDCTAMTKLISHAMTPPVCGSQALDDISKWVCTLSVPKGTVSSYQQAAQWKEFFFIDEGATGIQRTVSNDSKSFRTYNINGYEQNGQQRGLNIIRMSDGTVKKVMVK